MATTGARVGERLRAIRRQKGLSLHDVEARSTLEFKASVLGAYERGERAISVPRLLRLAEIFNDWLPFEKPEVTLDVFIPFSRAAAFLDWFEGQFQFFPLWCVPYRRVRDYEWLSPSFYAGCADELYLDLAIYGMKQPPDRNAYRDIEEALPRFGGLKTLISHNYYSKDEFWRIWNKENHDTVKALTDPNNIFRDLYEKTRGSDSGA